MQNKNSEQGWYLLVTELPELIEAGSGYTINWRDYTSKVDNWKPKEHKFHTYSELVKSLGDLPPVFRETKNYIARIEACKVLVEYKLFKQNSSLQHLIEYTKVYSHDVALVENINEVVHSPRVALFAKPSASSEVISLEGITKPSDSEKTVRHVPSSSVEKEHKNSSEVKPAIEFPSINSNPPRANPVFPEDAVKSIKESNRELLHNGRQATKAEHTRQNSLWVSNATRNAILLALGILICIGLYLVILVSFGR
ncbi:MAG: hypothetical protein QM730_14220 [Anaerolineales bacterium]